VAIVEEGTCRIKQINSKGMGVGQSEQGIVELPYTITGELVSFQRHTYRHKSNYVLVEVLEVSANRQEPRCEYFGKCGGCLLQHFTTQDYTALKTNMIVSNLEKQDIQTNVLPIVTVPPSQRRRANLEAVKKDDQIYMGFHKFHSNQIINIDHCPALIPELSSLLLPLKETLFKVLSHKQKAQVFLTLASNGIDITLEVYKQPRLSDEQRNHLMNFAKQNNLIKLIFRAKKFIDVIHQTEEPYVLFDNLPVQIDAHCFLQSSFESDQILKDLVLKHLPIHAPDTKLVDLFCGRGTYTLPLSRYFQVDGFESDPKAINALVQTSTKAERPIKIVKQDLFENPLKTAELNKYDFAVINPPRAGAVNQIAELSRSKINGIIYISCNPETFCADAKTLINDNYDLVEVTPLDQFYWSPHLEVIGFFKHKHMV
jgi:23S rRNA (uracil1939-C5)-methyltransferase